MKNVLITGGCGFIGSNLVNRLVERDDLKITVIDNMTSGRVEWIAGAMEKINFVRGSIGDHPLMNDLFKKGDFDVVVHLAAVPRVSLSVAHPTMTSQENITYSVHLLELCRNHDVKRMLFASSSSVYGDAKKFPTTEDTPKNPLSPYAWQKSAVEDMIRISTDLYDVDLCGMRFFNVFGPHQLGDSPYATVISAWLDCMFDDDKRPFLEGDGTQSRDFTYIDNVTMAIERLLDHDEKLGGEIYNVACGENHDLMKIKTIMEEHVGKPLNLEHRPPRPGDVHKTQASDAKLKGLFPDLVWEMGFEDGLKKTIDWYEDWLKIQELLPVEEHSIKDLPSKVLVATTKDGHQEQITMINDKTKKD